MMMVGVVFGSAFTARRRLVFQTNASGHFLLLGQSWRRRWGPQIDIPVYSGRQFGALQLSGWGNAPNAHFGAKGRREMISWPALSHSVTKGLGQEMNILYCNNYGFLVLKVKGYFSFVLLTKDEQFVYFPRISEPSLSILMIWVGGNWQVNIWSCSSSILYTKANSNDICSTSESNTAAQWDHHCNYPIENWK